MANDYEFISAHEDVEFLGGTKTRAVMTVAVYAGPHRTYLEFRIPRNLYSHQQVVAYGNGFAGSVSTLWALPGVVGVSYRQVPTPDGELQDVFDTTVQSTSGNSDAVVTIPFGILGTESATNKVHALREQLDAAEAG